MTIQLAIMKRNEGIREGLAVVLGSVFMALAAQVSIPLPFTPVPLSLHPHVALFLGATLGARRGALAVGLYLLEGACGLPVFSLGRSGLAHLMGPTGGYLIGFLAAAYFVGFMLERRRSNGVLLWSLFGGTALILGMGAFHLTHLMSLKSALLLGVAPFLVGDFLKLMVLYTALKRFKGSAFSS